MFLLGVTLLCSAAFLFVLTMLLFRNPKQTFVKAHDSIGDLLALLIVTFLFSGGISLVLSYQLQPPGTSDYGYGLLMMAGTVVLIKLLKVRRRLAVYDEAEQGRVITGTFSPSQPHGTDQSPYRKAA